MSSPNVLDLSSFSKELNFMLLLLRTDRQLTTEEAIEQSRDIDWKQFLAFVRYHHVYPTINQMLVRLDKEKSWVPSFVRMKLQSYFASNTFEMLHLRGELERVNSALVNQGIRSLMLKGPVLADHLYGDVSGRTSKDLDILVPKDDVERTEKLLIDLGYQLSEGAPELLNNTERKTHHLSYFHYDKGVEVELHWRLNPDTVKEPSFEELWRNRQSSSLNQEIYTLGDEDLYVYLVLHGARHAWSCLRWVLDMDRVLTKELNWHKLTEMFRAYKVIHLGGQAAVLTSHLFGTRLPKAAKQMTLNSRSYQLAQQTLPFIREQIILYPKPERKDIAIYFNKYLLSTMTMRQKRLYVLNKLYPSSWDALLLPLPKALHFLYFPLRPFLWFWRQVKRQST